MNKVLEATARAQATLVPMYRMASTPAVEHLGFLEDRFLGGAKAIRPASCRQGSPRMDLCPAGRDGPELYF